MTIISDLPNAMALLIPSPRLVFHFI